MGLVALITGSAIAISGGGCSATEDCVKNAFGAEFCGEEGKRYCARFGGPACKDLGWPTPDRRFP
jgi:hypothetical protein